MTHPGARWLVGLACLLAESCASLATTAQQRGAGAVTQWTLIGDYYGRGAANWRSLAILHMAMHDALNAAHSTYARWCPAEPDEPGAAGASPEVAMAAAAHEVLSLLHPDHRAETAASWQSVLAQYPDDAGKAAGEQLGAAVGRAAVARRNHDGFEVVHFFPPEGAPGRWRPTPNAFATSRTNDSRPFLFAAAAELPSVPPPALGTPQYLRELDETRRLGALASSERTAEQTEHAQFWAHQSSQRGFVDLAVRLLAARRLEEGVYAEARLLAELTLALADSAILTWYEKARYSFWRPITAIRAEGGDAAWAPLIETPAFPEYPSGHATDCYVGAAVLEAGFPELAGPILYRSSAYLQPLGRALPAAPTEFGMGQHAQPPPEQPSGGRSLEFQSLGALAADCARSRIWAGAHFAASTDESRRLASLIVERATHATRAPGSAGAACRDSATSTPADL